MQTQAAGHGRGVSIGRMYRRDGTLVAVVVSRGRTTIAGFINDLSKGQLADVSHLFSFCYNPTL